MFVASATLEERVSQLEITVAELEESLVEDYGLIKRCRLPTFEHGVASCNHLGKKSLESRIFRINVFQT